MRVCIKLAGKTIAPQGSRANDVARWLRGRKNYAERQPGQNAAFEFTAVSVTAGSTAVAPAGWLAQNHAPKLRRMAAENQQLEWKTAGGFA
jgi:hypothetical protein